MPGECSINERTNPSVRPVFMDAVLWGQQLGISKWTKQSFYSPGGGQCTRWDSRGTNESAIRWATVSAVRPRSRVRATTTRRSVGSSRPRDPGTSRGVVGQLREKPGLLLLLQWCLRRHGIGPDTTAEQSGPHSLPFTWFRLSLEEAITFFSLSRPYIHTLYSQLYIHSWKACCRFALWCFVAIEYSLFHQWSLIFIRGASSEAGMCTCTCQR